MKIYKRIIFFSLLFAGFILLIGSCSQSKSMRDIQRRSGRNERLLNKSESKKVRQAKEKAEDQKEKQDKAYEKAKKNDTERRMEMQSPETRQQMKEAQEKADKNNNRGKESFFKRLFKRKKPKSR